MTAAMDWDDAFDNSGYTPGSDTFPDAWAAAAAATRDRLGDRLREVAYGDGDRERLDLIAPEGDSAGVVVFVHGGYWLRFDRRMWTHLAEGALARGWTVALPSYPLAPDARIAAITQAVRQAVIRVADEAAGPVRLVGHSAGGHLVARMACEGVLPDAVADRVERVVPVSGVHDLMPLCETLMNQRLRLDAEEAAAESPVRLRPRDGLAVTLWCGAAERPEFLRQTRMLEERWLAAGADVGAVFEPGQDHFSVVDALRRPDTPLTEAVLL